MWFAFAIFVAVLLLAVGFSDWDDDDTKAPTPPNCTANPELCK